MFTYILFSLQGTEHTMTNPLFSSPPTGPVPRAYHVCAVPQGALQQRPGAALPG